TDLFRHHPSYRHSQNRTLQNKVKFALLLAAGVLLGLMCLFLSYNAAYVVADYLDVLVNVRNSYVFAILNYVFIIATCGAGAFFLHSLFPLTFLLLGYDRFGKNGVSSEITFD